MKDETVGQKMSNEEQYPSVALAYDIALRSYDWVYGRSEVMDDKIEKLIAWTTGITIALIAAMSKTTGCGLTVFNSFWFYVALVLLVTGISIGVWARFHSKLKMISPALLYQHWLRLTEWEFKKNILYRIGEDIDYNKDLVNKKGDLALVTVFIFLGEAVALVVWFISLQK